MYTLILMAAFIIILVVYVFTSIKKIKLISSNKFRKPFERLLIIVGLVSLVLAAYYFSVNYLTKNSKDLLIYGDGISFSLVSPANWTVDTAQKERGIQAAFYKKGETSDNFTVQLYTQTVAFDSGSTNNLEKVIQDDVGMFKKSYKDIAVTDGIDIVVEDRPGTKSTAKVKYFSNPTYPRYEAVAYIDGHKAGVIIVMSAKSKNDFDKNLPVFEDLVKSYFFVTDKVVVK